MLQLDIPMLQDDIDAFVQGYKEAAMWTSYITVEEEGVDVHYRFDELDPMPEWSEEAAKKMEEICGKFLVEADGFENNYLGDYLLELEYDPSEGNQASHLGHSLWCYAYGSGFDMTRGPADETLKGLDVLAEKHPSPDLYIGDDGKIYAG
jgi:hypothetical protein